MRMTHFTTFTLNWNLRFFLYSKSLALTITQNPKEQGDRLVALPPGVLCLKWRAFLAGEDVPSHRAYQKGGLWQKQETSPECLYRKQILKLIRQIELTAAAGEAWAR